MYWPPNISTLSIQRIKFLILFLISYLYNIQRLPVYISLRCARKIFRNGPLLISYLFYYFDFLLGENISSILKSELWIRYVFHTLLIDLIIYCVTSRSRVFHLLDHVTITGEGLQNLGLSSALRAFAQGGIFIVPHLLWHGTSVFLVSPEGLPHSVASYDMHGDAEDLFKTQILTGLYSIALFYKLGYILPIRPEKRGLKSQWVWQSGDPFQLKVMGAKHILNLQTCHR